MDWIEKIVGRLKGKFYEKEATNGKSDLENFRIAMEKVGGPSVLSDVWEIIQKLEVYSDVTETVKISVLKQWLWDVFDNRVWREIDKVYETRWDCPTGRLAAA